MLLRCGSPCRVDKLRLTHTFGRPLDSFRERQVQSRNLGPRGCKAAADTRADLLAQTIPIRAFARHDAEMEAVGSFGDLILSDAIQSLHGAIEMQRMDRDFPTALARKVDDVIVPAADPRHQPEGPTTGARRRIDGEHVRHLVAYKGLGAIVEVGQQQLEAGLARRYRPVPVIHDFGYEEILE